MTWMRHLCSGKIADHGDRAVMLVAKPGEKPATWHTHVVHPKWQLTDQAAKCLDQMKALIEVLITGWMNQQTSNLFSHPALHLLSHPAHHRLSLPALHCFCQPVLHQYTKYDIIIF
ncbi:hypothetical protein CHARACLAT_027946 [Characodon lateralis]|uniref:Uncharacterized protein n=1 Tax=Characodon lateralis TaxID=208331 RepID=A0ABU7DAR8_9TELE|nr:hypothetical protein [Characodon lateralis]